MSENIDETKAIKLPSELSSTAVPVDSEESAYDGSSDTLDEETVEQLVEDRFVSGIVAPHARKKPTARTARPAGRKRKKKRSFAMNALIVLLISVFICIACFITSYLMFSQPDDSSEKSNPYDYSTGGKPPVKTDNSALEEVDEPETKEDNDETAVTEEKAEDKQDKKEDTKPAQKEPSVAKPQKNNSVTNSEKEPVSETIKPSKPEKEKPSGTVTEKEDTPSAPIASKPAPEKPSDSSSNEGIVFE